MVHGRVFVTEQLRITSTTQGQGLSTFTFNWNLSLLFNLSVNKIFTYSWNHLKLAFERLLYSGIASLTVLSSSFLIFPQIVLIFNLILALRVGESPTRESHGYAIVIAWQRKAQYCLTSWCFIVNYIYQINKWLNLTRHVNVTKSYLLCGRFAGDAFLC